MPTVAEFITLLGTIAPFSKAAGWDPVGLQIGDPSAEVTRVAVCHEVTESVLAALDDQEVDLVVAYHPLLFKETRSLVASTSPAGRAFRLIRSGTALAVVHTAFDVASGGAADALAAELGLGDVRPFGPVWGADRVKVVTFVPEPFADDVADAMAGAGAGSMGDYTACSFRVSGTGTFLPGPHASPALGEPGVFNREPEVRIEMVADPGRVEAVVAALVSAHPYEEPVIDINDRRGDAGMIGRVGRLDSTVDEVAALAAERLGAVVRVAGSGPVESVAVVPGSGSAFIGAAAPIADVLVTGDVGHHRARDSVSRGLAVVDPGHAETERPGMRALYAAVSEMTDAIDLTATDPTPWRGI
ncbi:MAG: Nif3-like dinuclear metal center hexameric protein [Acidimicrobiia bacterium]|nr:Nif3-like dinuclear metal center hexameric protein [Acidimicrobiia bacterium]